MKIKIMLLLVGLVNINLGAIELPDANSALKPPPTDLKPTVVGIPNRIGDGNNTTLPIDDKPPIQILPIDDSPPPPGGKVEDELAKNPFIDYKSEYEKSVVEISSLKEQVTELSNRLVQSEKDKTDSIADLNKRIKELESSLKNAKEELTHANEYKHIIINDSFDDAKKELFSIIAQEKPLNRENEEEVQQFLAQLLSY